MDIYSGIKTRREFWIPKIEKNIKRDEVVNKTLENDGWIVLRFSERQFIDEPAGVARTVMNVVRLIAPDLEMPKHLRDVSPVEPDPRWDYDTALSRAKSRYRNTYMDKHFVFRLTHLIGI